MRSFLSPVLALALFGCSGGFDGGGDKPQGADGKDDAADDGGDGADGGEDGGDDGGDDGVGEADVDDDNDGYTENEGDCNDDNSDVHPGADEYCNNRDDDCDGEIDDPDDLASGQGSTRFEDADGDGFGNASVTAQACDHSGGWVDDGTDCDDTAASAHPGGVEQNWNGIDEDCDGEDFDLQGCMARAVQNTSATMTTGSPWALDDFRGEYDLSITIPIYGPATLTGAGFGEVNDQLAFITEVSTGIYEETSEDTYAVAFETEIGYNNTSDPFALVVGISADWWDWGYFGYTVGGIITGAIELVTTVPEGFDGTVTCYGYVDPIPSDFDGSLSLNINASAGTVTSTVDLASNVTTFGESDTTLASVSGGQCGNEIINTIAGYIGIGDTYRFLNDNLELVGESLVEEYAVTLEAEIAAECSR